MMGPLALGCPVMRAVDGSASGDKISSIAVNILRVSEVGGFKFVRIGAWSVRAVVVHRIIGVEIIPCVVSLRLGHDL